MVDDGVFTDHDCESAQVASERQWDRERDCVGGSSCVAFRELIRNGGLRVAASGCARASELDCRCCRRKHMRRGGLVGDRARPHATSGRDRHCRSRASVADNRDSRSIANSTSGVLLRAQIQIQIQNLPVSRFGPATRQRRSNRIPELKEARQRDSSTPA